MGFTIMIHPHPQKALIIGGGSSLQSFDFNPQVLKGLDLATTRPKVIAVEVHAANLFDALSGEVATYLTGKRYVPMASTVITHFFVDSEVL